MTVLMTPDMANFAGNVHGGTTLKFLDQVAYFCASGQVSDNPKHKRTGLPLTACQSLDAQDFAGHLRLRPCGWRPLRVHRRRVAHNNSGIQMNVFIRRKSDVHRQSLQ